MAGTPTVDAKAMMRNPLEKPPRAPSPPFNAPPPYLIQGSVPYEHERPPTSQRFHALLKQLGNLYDKKMQDYGTTDDPLFNVRGSQEWGVKPWIGAMVRANDKVKRLQKFAGTGELANESVEDAFMDLAGYALIGLVLYEEMKK